MRQFSELLYIQMSVTAVIAAIVGEPVSHLEHSHPFYSAQVHLGSSVIMVRAWLLMCAL